MIARAPLEKQLTRAILPAVGAPPPDQESRPPVSKHLP